MNPTETYERALDHLLRYKPEVHRSRRSSDHRTSRLRDGPRPDGLSLPHRDRRAGARRRRGPPRRRCSSRRGTIGQRCTPPRSEHGWPATGTVPRRSSTTCCSPGRPTCWPCRSDISSTSSSATPATSAIARPARSTRSHADDPRGAAVRGMYAFGLEESGQYEKAEEVGMSAIEVHPDDVWAIHAVVHTLEMRGLVDRGIPFLREPRRRLGRRQPVHRPQLVAPGAVRAGGRAPRRGARHLRPASAQRRRRRGAAGDARCQRPAVAAEARRGRLGTRFAALADAWASRTADEPWYVFNDLHAAMAFAGAGRFDDAAAVVAKLEAGVPEGTAVSNAMMTAEVGLPATRAVVAFAEDRHDDVVEALAPIRRNLHRFGGSHAQRDVLLRTLLESALRSGRYQFADELISERLSEREIERVRLDSAPADCPRSSVTARSAQADGRPTCGRFAACLSPASAARLSRGGTVTPLRHRGGMIFATRCAGCHARGPVLCRTCRFALVARPAPGAPADIVVATAYSGRVRDVLLGLKYHNRRQVAAHVAGVLAGRLVGRAGEHRRRHVGADERVAAQSAGVRSG